MEFKARYEVIGLFTLAVVAAMFGFVYWLNNLGGLGERTLYEVRFNVPVSGLSVGGGVYFNGIRVGDVINIELDKKEPSQLNTTISVKKATPIRADTVAGIEYQGLTGVSAILLTGGAADAPALKTTNGKIPLIIADPAASRSWTDSAGKMLSRLDSMLSRNSGRVDEILSGLARMTGGGGETKETPVFDLLPPQNFPHRDKPAAWTLVVADPTVPLAFNTDKILKQVNGDEALPLPGGRWADNLPNLLQTKIIQSFENAGFMNEVLRPIDVPDPDNKLLIDIRGFFLTTDKTPAAVIDLVAKIVDRDGKIIAARPLKASVAASSADIEDAVKALDTAFKSVATDLVTWTSEKL